MPAYKAPKYDIPNIASKLPEPLRKPAGMAMQGLMDVFGGEEADVSQAAPTPLTPAVGAVRIPLDRLSNLLKSGFAEDMIDRVAKSRILKNAYAPRNVGSPEVARIASGMRPERHRTVGWQSKFHDSSIDEPQFSGIPYGSTKADARLASQELYDLSQRTLDELRVPKDETVELFRSGTLPKSKHLLTPTHVDVDQASNWKSFDQPFNKYEVPRKDIRALVGLLQRGDDLTTGEILVPSHTLAETAIMPPVKGPDPRLINLPRIPSWYKREVLKPKP